MCDTLGQVLTVVDDLIVDRALFSHLEDVAISRYLLVSNLIPEQVKRVRLGELRVFVYRAWSVR